MLMVRLTRIALWSLVVIALILIGILVRSLFLDGDGDSVAVFGNGPIVGEPALGAAAVTIGEPFALVTDAGAPIGDDDLDGHPSLMFFGFTFCPDVCPTALAEVSGWLAELGNEAEDLAVYFVTVDPARDQPAEMATYLTAFDPRIVGITGPVDDVHAMLDGYRVFYERYETDNGYLMDHAASFYMLDRNGEFVGTIGYNELRDEALRQIRRLIAGG
jgi:protein SCO1/2